MDLETENRIAAILMKEAAELRRQAEKEGVHVYLQQRKPSLRPNTRFLTATVLGVQQCKFFLYLYLYIYIYTHTLIYHTVFFKGRNVAELYLFNGRNVAISVCFLI